MKAQILHGIIRFLYSRNVDEIETIFKGKISDSVLSHLINKKNSYKLDNDDNLYAWFDFIGNLDNENSEILFDYIFKERGS